MAYKWKPSASQRKAFAERMADPNESAAYEQRKKERLEKKRASSKFDYGSAGGNYIPTKAQHDFVAFNRPSNLTPEQDEACNVVGYGFICSEKVHHDYIHLVNELIRTKQQ